jgi:uncharacterized protein (TIGR02271 family)
MMSIPTTDRTTLVSLFHTQAEASKALSDLEAAGVPTQFIQTLGGEVNATAAPESSLATLKDLDLPANDLEILADGLKSGGLLIVVRAEYAIAEKAEEVFEHHARKIDERTATTAQTQPVAVAAAVGGGTVIPIVEEVLNIGKRKVERGTVRVFSRLVETPVEEQVVLQEEHVTVERHKVDRSISSAELDALQNQSLEVHEMAEEAVVAKSARVVEEVRIGKDTTERSQQIKDTLRKTQVDVDPLATDELQKVK